MQGGGQWLRPLPTASEEGGGADKLPQPPSEAVTSTCYVPGGELGIALASPTLCKGGGQSGAGASLCLCA